MHYRACPPQSTPLPIQDTSPKSAVEETRKTSCQQFDISHPAAFKRRRFGKLHREFRVDFAHLLHKRAYWSPLLSKLGLPISKGHGYAQMSTAGQYRTSIDVVIGAADGRLRNGTRCIKQKTNREVLEEGRATRIAADDSCRDLRPIMTPPRLAPSLPNVVHMPFLRRALRYRSPPAFDPRVMPTTMVSNHEPSVLLDFCTHQSLN